MSKYLFDAAKSICIDLPMNAVLIISLDAEKMTFHSNYTSNSSYTVNDWRMNIVKKERLRFSFIKRINPEIERELNIIVRSEVGMTSPPVLSYYPRKGTFDKREFVSPSFSVFEVHLKSTGLMEVKEYNEEKESASSRHNPENSRLPYNNSSYEMLSVGSDPSIVVRGENQEQSDRNRLRETEEGIRKIKDKIMDLEMQIKAKQAEYRRLEQDYKDKSSELKKQIADLRLLESNGKMEVSALQEEYREKLSELSERFGDSRFALEKISSFRNSGEELEEEFQEIERRIRSLDDTLIRMAEEAEQEGKDVASAIFDNDGKLVRS